MSAERFNEFYRSGEGDIAYVCDLLSKMGVKIRAEKAMDFGCGVGRLTSALSHRFDSVIGFDISANHLAIARQNLVEKFGITNVDFRDVSDEHFNWQTYKNKFDFIFSLIVLQHIPFLQLAPTIENLFRCVSKGGIIAMQLPTFHPNYSFDSGIYSSGAVIDSHFLVNGMRERDLNILAKDNGLTNVGVVEWDCVGSNWISKFFVFERL